jgi:CubicO group peptidase (beta-lactamase class C family)
MSQIYKIEGSAALGFEPIKDLFESNFAEEIDRFSQLCIYVGEEKVVDLWGSIKEENLNKVDKARGGVYGPDSLTCIWSSSKAVSDIVFAKLREQCLINFEDKVSQHWPEFAQNGK